MNPANSIAVGFTQILNGNLYVCSWISFVCIVYIFGDLLSDMYRQNTGTATSNLDTTTGEYIQLQTKRLWDTRRGKWYVLLTVSGIVISSCVRTYQAFDCYLTVMKTLSNTCQDSKIGISMSVLGGCLAMILSCVNGVVVTNNNNNNNDNTNDNNNNNNDNTALIIESIGSVVSTIVWTIAWGFITFGEGPGHSLGNLYFSTWVAFVISILITIDCVQDYMAMDRSVSAVTSASEEMIEQENEQQHEQHSSRQQVGELPSAADGNDNNYNNNGNNTIIEMV